MAKSQEMLFPCALRGIHQDVEITRRAMTSTAEPPQLLTQAEVTSVLASIRPGTKIEVRWRTITGPRSGTRGTDRGILFEEDGSYLLRRSANTYIPFFDPSIGYEGVDMCREQSAPAARRLRDAENEDERARRPPRPEALAATTPTHRPDEHPAIVAPVFRPGTPPPATPFHHPPQQLLNLNPQQFGNEVPRDSALTREIIHQMNDPRRTRAWGDPAWDIRTTPFGWATHFDILSFRMRYGPEALTRWRGDRPTTVERLRLEMASQKGSHQPGALTPGFMEQAHWAEWQAAHLLEALITPRTPEEARAWIHAGLGLLSAYCLMLGNTPKASAVWATGAKLWSTGKVDFEECANFRRH